MGNKAQQGVKAQLLDSVVFCFDQLLLFFAFFRLLPLIRSSHNHHFVYSATIMCYLCVSMYLASKPWLTLSYQTVNMESLTCVRIWACTVRWRWDRHWWDNTSVYAGEQKNCPPPWTGVELMVVAFTGSPAQHTNNWATAPVTGDCVFITTFVKNIYVIKWHWKGERERECMCVCL